MSMLVMQHGLMVCGIDTYQCLSRLVGGLVSSTNDNCTRWFSRVCHQARGKQLIHGLQVCFIAAIKKYHEVRPIYCVHNLLHVLQLHL